MHRIDGPGATVDNKFTDGNPASSVPATVVTADWLTELQEEMLSILTAASIAPVKGDQDQVLTAIQAMIAASIPAVSTDGIAGSFANLKASASGLSAAVSITADALCVKNAAGQQKVLGAVAVTPSFANAGVNGLDVGVANSQTANTWYYLWVIWNGTTTAGLLSLSATAPTMPAGYTHKARVGAVRTDGTGNKYPLSFIQAGRKVRYKVAAGSNVTTPPVMSSGAVTWPASVAVGAFVPPTASHINLAAYLLAVSTAAYVAPNGAYAQTDCPIAQVSAGAQGGTFSSIVSMQLESTNITYGAGASTKLLCFGWEDNL